MVGHTEVREDYETRSRREEEGVEQKSRRRILSAVPFPKPPVVPETGQTVYIAVRLAHSNVKHSFYRERNSSPLLNFRSEIAVKVERHVFKRTRPVSSVV